MGTSLTAEEVLTDQRQLQHQGEHLYSEEVLHRAQNLLHWYEENII